MKLVLKRKSKGKGALLKTLSRVRKRPLSRSKASCRPSIRVLFVEPHRIRERLRLETKSSSFGPRECPSGPAFRVLLSDLWLYSDVKSLFFLGNYISNSVVF
ncbi:hypothetical protein PNOK_0748400 [Pyrrhoderma noxium]|uniref:Uncharacterized protein n=1 Tax=Pyrrhoderma noxium TaxID=2282107 RepID=A0A286UCW7_9AGAM|nr:hypothetical protein PNOK_0748400 [Pyrrhoderma noxium]